VENLALPGPGWKRGSGTLPISTLCDPGIGVCPTLFRMVKNKVDYDFWEGGGRYCAVRKIECSLGFRGARSKQLETKAVEDHMVENPPRD